MDNLYVIIVTYNGEQWIHKCIDSVFKSTINSTVIVVDNKSCDNTIQYIKKYYPTVVLFENKINLGFGKANNIGIAYALKKNADYIYLLNQDAWVEPDTFEVLIRNQKANPEFGVLSPMQMNASKNRIDNYFASLSLAPNKDNILSDLYLKKYKDIYEVDFVMAAHWLISKECLMKVGGFSPVFYHYGEDNNFLQRIHYHKYKSGICPHTQSVHDREYRSRKPSELFYLKYTCAFLVDMNNINNSFAKSITKAFFHIIIDETKYMIKYKSIKPLYYIFKSLFSIHKTLNNRKTTKTAKLTFLK